MNKFNIRNSFLDEKVKKTKVLIIVPHEDDEINVAGNVILDFLHKGAMVYCAFTTNGDYSFMGKTRIHEAVASLHLLGVKNIFFLGYGDSPGYYEKGHIFNSEHEIIESHSGHSETYGTDSYPDFAWLRRKKHSTYCKYDFENDMKDLILYLKADIIFCVDCDVHTDHRACSLMFEKVMGNILRKKENEYHPIIFKGFAYCTAFDAPVDFYQSNNILSTKNPNDGNKNNIIGIACYEWEKRVRFPILSDARAMSLCKNILYKALFEHKSQSIALRACRIINGDNVFWRRRTDSISYQASIVASSGCGDRLNDFQLINFNNICDRQFNFGKYLWMPAENDVKKEVIFSWSQKHTISLINLYGNINRDGRILQFSISFDNGYFNVFGPMPENGNVFTICFPKPQNIQKCVIRILKWSGEIFGLSECEFYSQMLPCNDIRPFIKMKIGDDFAYEYVINKKQKSCQIKLYSYPCKFPVSFRILQGNNSSIDKTGKLIFNDSDKEIILRVEAQGVSGIYDEIMIRRVSFFYLCKNRLRQKLEQIGLTVYLKKYRKYIHIKQKYLKKI